MSNWSPFLLDVSPSRFLASARVVGACLLPLAGLVGVVWCAQIMRRRRISRPGIGALLLVFGALTFWSAIGAGIALFEWPGELRFGIAPVVAVMCLAALILGLIAVIRYDITYHRQGRAQAVCAIAVTSVLFYTTIAVFVVGGGQGFSRALASPAPPKQSAPEHNFTLQAPSGWQVVSPRSLNNLEATMAFRKASPDLSMLVIPETLGGGPDLAAYTASVKSRMQLVAEIREVQEEKVTIGGLTFQRIASQVKFNGSNADVSYEQWLATQGGYYWQLVLWGIGPVKAEVEAEARKFVAGFSLIDPNAKTQAGGTLTDISRPDTGIFTHLAGFGWNKSEKAMRDSPLPLLIAARGFEGLLVLPVRLPSTPPDLDTVASGLVATLGFAWPPVEGVTQSRAVTTPLGEGREIETERRLDGDPYRYVFRVVRGAQSAVMVCGWADKERGDFELIRRSIEAIDVQPPKGETLPLTPEQRRQVGSIFNQMGMACVRHKDYPAAITWFGHGFSETKEDPLCLYNLAFALATSGRKNEALDAMAPYADRFAHAYQFQTYRAVLLSEVGLPEDGDKLFRSLVERGMKDEDQLFTWLKALGDIKRYDLAVPNAEAWVKRLPSARSRRWLADMLAGKGDYIAAVTVLDKLSTEMPQDEETACQLSEVLNIKGDYTRAGEIMEKWLGSGRESTRGRLALGWSQMGRRMFQEAKANFERAAAREPDAEYVQIALRRASSALGQGNNSEVKQPLKLVAIPPEVERALDAVKPPEKFGAGYSAVMLRRVTGYSWKKGEPIRRTIYRRIKVQDQAGVEAYSTLQFPFDPLGERIFVNRVEVRGADGKPVAEHAVSDAYVRDAEGPEATNAQVLHVPVPGLRPGSTLEVEVTVEDRGPIDDFPFTRHLVYYGVPAVAEAFFITGDPARVEAATSGPQPFQKITGDKFAAWMLSNIPAREVEPMAISPESLAPQLCLGNKRQTWAEVGQEYLKSISDRLPLDEGAKALAVEHCAGLKTDREKFAALARWVQKEINYKAIEFGVRARRPNAPSETIRHRYGDCKDLSLLLHQLLKSVGVESQLVVIHNSLAAQPELPSLDQFNHMILRVPCLGDDWLVDPTDRYLGLDRWPADNLWRAQGLLLDPANPRLLPLPPGPRAGSATVESRRTVTPIGADWSVEEKLTVHGYYGSWMRASFTNESAEAQTRHAQRILADYGSAELKDFSIENLDAVEQPLRMTLNYLVRNAIKTNGGKSTATLPALWERNYTALTFVPQRKTPFVLRYPFRFDSEVQVRLPAQARLTLASTPASPFAKSTVKTQPPGPTAPDLWTVHTTFDAPSGERPASDYAACYAAWEAGRRVWDEPVEWPAK